MTETPDWVKRKLEQHDTEIREMRTEQALNRRENEIMRRDLTALRKSIAEGRSEDRDRHNELVEKLGGLGTELSEARGGLKVLKWVWVVAAALAGGAFGLWKFLKGG